MNGSDLGLKGQEIKDEQISSFIFTKNFTFQRNSKFIIMKKGGKTKKNDPLKEIAKPQNVYLSPKERAQRRMIRTYNKSQTSSEIDPSADIV